MRKKKFVCMSPESEELLDDILDMAKEVQGFVEGMTYEMYRSDSRTRLAVERSFEIIGEALNRIKKVEPEILESIREHRSIISFRNILAHAYDSVEDKIVWGIIEADLPGLIEDIERIR